MIVELTLYLPRIAGGVTFDLIKRYVPFKSQLESFDFTVCSAGISPGGEFLYHEDFFTDILSERLSPTEATTEKLFAGWDRTNETQRIWRANLWDRYDRYSLLH